MAKLLQKTRLPQMDYCIGTWLTWSGALAITLEAKKSRYETAEGYLLFGIQEDVSGGTFGIFGAVV